MSNITKDVGKILATMDDPGEDIERELTFAIAAADVNDAANLRWLAACAIKRAEDISA